MKNIILLALLISLAGCGAARERPALLDFFNGTAPGAAVPIDHYWGFCAKFDEVQRCTQWEKPSDQCVNPKGHDATPPIVPCASIKKPEDEDLPRK